ncbi:hypothetical protein [Euzebya pacifica]|uniref:RsiG family protein n=1 Tax=Euzebya pacifica TaxID=1608957 RepID=UPI0030F8C8B5
MTDAAPYRRRIDRITDEDFLDGLADLVPADIRTMRDDCREEEARLSYARRLLHGQLDIALAELQRREGTDADSLVSTLTTILTDEAVGGPRSVSNSEVYVPTGKQGRRRGDRVLEEMPLGRLPDLTDPELVAAVQRLKEEEQAISALRRKVMDNLDRLQQELIARYRDGAASINDVVRTVEG